MATQPSIRINPETIDAPHLAARRARAHLPPRTMRAITPSSSASSRVATRADRRATSTMMPRRPSGTDASSSARRCAVARAVDVEPVYDWCVAIGSRRWRRARVESRASRGVDARDDDDELETTDGRRRLPKRAASSSKTERRA